MTNAKEFLDSDSVMFATVLMCCNSWQRKIRAPADRRSLHACTCPLCTWSRASPFTTVLPIMNHSHGHSYVWPCKSWRPLAHFRYCGFLIFFFQIKLTQVDAYCCHFQGSFLSLRLWRHPTRCLQSVAAAASPLLPVRHPAKVPSVGGQPRQK